MMRAMVRGGGSLVCWLWACSLAGGVPAQDLQARNIHNPEVRYAPPSKIRVFPTPLLRWDDAITKAEKAEIFKKLLYPLLSTSGKPVAAIFVQVAPKKARRIHVQVYWHVYGFVELNIPRNKPLRISKSLYKSLLSEADEN